MRYNLLGRTGLFISQMCLGTMTFGGSAGLWSKIGGVGQADAERLVGMAIDAGINCIDTADVYSGGESERILSRPAYIRPEMRSQIAASMRNCVSSITMRVSRGSRFTG